MLLAEIHGKRLDEARGREDYLTSTVFGHLRYVPPDRFWGGFLGIAGTAPDTNAVETSLSDALCELGVALDRYSRLEVRFWYKDRTFGEPDLCLIFSGGGQESVAILIEVKLWADKSGIGERDQLARYWNILDTPTTFADDSLPLTHRFLLYLTPRESSTSVASSLGAVEPSRRESFRKRLFRLQWQDMAVAAEASCVGALEPTPTILKDIRRFLGCLGLVYFRGFQTVGLADFPISATSVYRSTPFRFDGFFEVDLERFQTQKARWL